MSQRARAHTTGATHKTTEPASAAPAADLDATHANDRVNAAPDSATSATSATTALPSDRSASADAQGMARAGVEPLARALRAMATELERDPALARRVADAMQAPGQPDGRSVSDGAHPASPIADGGAPIAARPTASATSATSATSADNDAGAVEDGQATGAAPSRVNRTFHPRIVTGAPPELGMGVPDPFALAERLGEAGLRAALGELRLGSLRAIVREHRLDPTGRLVGLNDAAKFRAVIAEAVHAARATTKSATPKRAPRKGRKSDN